MVGAKMIYPAFASSLSLLLLPLRILSAQELFKFILPRETVWATGGLNRP